ncbi:hypothetical protein [Rhizobium hainanense]|nr:hypothetical protein [Rhizobium hainanense]
MPPGIEGDEIHAELRNAHRLGQPNLVLAVEPCIRIGNAGQACRDRQI